MKVKRVSRKLANNNTAPNYPVLYNMYLLPRQSIDRMLSISSASLHRGYTSLYCNAVMKSIHPLCYGTRDLNPLPRVSQRLHTRKIHDSLGDHSLDRLWCEWDVICYREEADLFRGWRAVLNCANRWGHLLLSVLLWLHCYCLHWTLIQLFFHSCCHLFFLILDDFLGCFQPCSPIMLIWSGVGFGHCIFLTSCFHCT